MKEKPVPFSLHVADEDIDDLRARLARTRFPDQAPGEPWQAGTDVAYLADLVDYWRDGFDWRAQEAALNAFPQYNVGLHGIDLHYLHVQGNGPAPMPLVLLHGWPGSVFEFIEIIPLLTDPARFGGDPRDAFTLVVPSLPGYGLSFRPNQPRFDIPAMTECVFDLMHGVLGYERFGAQGGDWGSAIASRLGYVHPDAMIGVHLNYMSAASRDPAAYPNPTADEQRYLDQLAHWTYDGSAYSSIQGTRPQSLAFGLTDSPAGLAAWIVEKFRAWSDCGGDVERAISRDKMLADIALYWFTGSINASFWPYYGRMHGAVTLPPGDTIGAPTGYAEFPREILRPPRSAAERVFTDLRRWSVMPKGGHFAALEQPELLASEVRAFFGALR
ncbi:multidrug MFS transporter [Caballeronia arationis]|jgi:microsomal epoxide hydrolase|uniref:Pimeloyl-ACP methyl ester carboxylesterase n=1 Tax=Caballeronia arationis TaxID=1777142 RepID=A0A7Z7N1X4_9BURK|nr:epoxide hydrolase family protein [Caballeronia arationis]SAL03970.1 multidrug MFS transporter [Caballeronia arationis]SOE58328.1 Pimeloyl-ACP methyl ester carboxylesterase [Caballeronia arationis]